MGPHMTGAAAAGEPGRTSFYYSFSFLPRRQRDALATVYEFCRRTDDLVDDHAGDSEKRSRLEEWRRELALAPGGRSAVPVLNRTADVARMYDIPLRHFHDLVDGVEMDTLKKRYATFPELVRYCELVASSVGLMCINIFGSRNERTVEYARLLGIALQLTNIVRDVGDDAGLGRIYIPAEDLVRFSCPEDDIIGRVHSPSFRDLMEFETGRAREYYLGASACLLRRDRPAMYPAMVMAGIYRRILDAIRKSDYRVFGQHHRLAKWRQLLIAFPYIVGYRIRRR